MLENQTEAGIRIRPVPLAMPRNCEVSKPAFRSRNGLDDFGSSEWHDVIRDVVVPGGAKAEATLDDWLRKKAEENVGTGRVGFRIERFVRGHVHDANVVGLDEVLQIAKSPHPEIRTQHALRRLGGPTSGNEMDDWDLKSNAPGNEAVGDFNTPWSMTQVLHGILKLNGRVPRWGEVHDFLAGKGKSYYLQPLGEALRDGAGPFARRANSKLTWQEVYDGFLWRWGLAYYSFLREIHLMAALRDTHGLPVVYNILADCLFKIDLRCGNVLVPVFIRNKHFREGDLGRKERIEDKMDVSGFRIVEVDLETPVVYGKAVLLNDRQIAGVAASIKAAMALGA